MKCKWTHWVRNLIAYNVNYPHYYQQRDNIITIILYVVSSLLHDVSQVSQVGHALYIQWAPATSQYRLIVIIVIVVVVVIVVRVLLTPNGSYWVKVHQKKKLKVVIAHLMLSCSLASRAPLKVNFKLPLIYDVMRLSRFTHAAIMVTQYRCW